MDGNETIRLNDRANASKPNCVDRKDSSGVRDVAGTWPSPDVETSNSKNDGAQRNSSEVRRRRLEVKYVHTATSDELNQGTLPSSRPDTSLPIFLEGNSCISYIFRDQGIDSTIPRCCWVLDSLSERKRYSL